MGNGTIKSCKNLIKMSVIILYVCAKCQVLFICHYLAAVVQNLQWDEAWISASEAAVRLAKASLSLAQLAESSNTHNFLEGNLSPWGRNSHLCRKTTAHNKSMWSSETQRMEIASQWWLLWRALAEDEGTACCFGIVLFNGSMDHIPFTWLEPDI